MKPKNHLSIFGIGPLYTLICCIFTMLIYVLNEFDYLPRLESIFTTNCLRIISLICFLIAVILWINAVLIQKIDRHIIHNHLVTTGSYAWVRNPIYSAIMFLMWGILLWLGNLYLLFCLLFYPVFMTILLKVTEEKWLLKQYGDCYLDYCKQVNRCFPWFPKKDS